MFEVSTRTHNLNVRIESTLQFQDDSHPESSISQPYDAF